MSTHTDGLSAPSDTGDGPGEDVAGADGNAGADVETRGVAPGERVEPVRSRADQRMRRLLRIEGRAEPGAIFGAQRAMTGSIAVSAVRCTITYLLVPILTPVVGVLDMVAAPLSLVLCSVAVVMSTRSMRRFWRADHAKRWHYTALVAAVWTFLAVAAVRDITQLL